MDFIARRARSCPRRGFTCGVITVLAGHSSRRAEVVGSLGKDAASGDAAGGDRAVVVHLSLFEKLTRADSSSVETIAAKRGSPIVGAKGSRPAISLSSTRDGERDPRSLRRGSARSLPAVDDASASLEARRRQASWHRADRGLRMAFPPLSARCGHGSHDGWACRYES
jgi:hypothetical protein